MIAGQNGSAPDARSPERPPRIPRPAPAPRCASPAIELLAARLAERLRDDRGTAAELLGEFWAGDASHSPMVETGPAGETILTFLWRSWSARDVLLLVNRLSDGADLDRSLLERLPVTDIWHLSYTLDPRWRGSYGFLVHEGESAPPWAVGADGERPPLRELFAQAGTDPRNPLSCPMRSGHPLSVAEGPSAPPQPWRSTSADPAPSALRETCAPDGRRCWLFGEDRAGARTDGAPVALWLILDGEVWAERFRLHAALDAMIALGGSPPVCAVLVDSGGEQARWAELAQGTRFAETLAESYLPWARERFGVELPASACGIAGQSLGGLVALRGGLERPDAFGLVLAQSPSLWLGPPSLQRFAGFAGTERPGGERPSASPRVRIEVGDQEWVLLDRCREMHSRMLGAGLGAQLVEYAGGHDYACWRGGLLDGIAALSGPREGSREGFAQATGILPPPLC